MTLDTGVCPELVMPFLPQLPLPVLLSLEPSLEGLQSPRRKPFHFQSYGPTFAFGPHNRPPSAQRLGLVPFPVSGTQQSADCRQDIW